MPMSRYPGAKPPPPQIPTPRLSPRLSPPPAPPPRPPAPLTGGHLVQSGVDKQRAITERFGDKFKNLSGLFKKGGAVTAKAKAKAPVKKAMGGKVAAKPMGKPVMKKAGGRVAAKPMMKGRKK